MHYRGILTAVNAEYTMFNPAGRPIRAVVNISLLLVDEKVKANDMGYWDQSYQNAFGENHKNPAAAVESFGNLVNLNL